MEIQLAKALGRAAALAGTQLGNIQLDWRRGALVIKTSLGFDAHFLETFRQVLLTAPPSAPARRSSANRCCGGRLRR